MKVGVITITWNRLWYTHHCLKRLKKMAGCEYEHIVIDNGSKDGTYEYLTEEGYNVIRNEKNMGIVHAFYQGYEQLTDCELIIKIDNDCEIITDDVIKKVATFNKENPDLIVSPMINGLNNPPAISRREKVDGLTFCETGMIGGIFFPHPVMDFIPNNNNDGEHLDDCVISPYYISKGYRIGYIEEWQANHFETTNGQIERYGEKSGYIF